MRPLLQPAVSRSTRPLPGQQGWIALHKHSQQAPTYSQSWTSPAALEPPYDVLYKSTVHIPRPTPAQPQLQAHPTHLHWPASAAGIVNRAWAYDVQITHVCSLPTDRWVLQSIRENLPRAISQILLGPPRSLTVPPSLPSCGAGRPSSPIPLLPLGLRAKTSAMLSRVQAFLAGHSCRSCYRTRVLLRSAARRPFSLGRTGHPPLELPNRDSGPLGQLDPSVLVSGASLSDIISVFSQNIFRSVRRVETRRGLQ
jgi:hypothetical protein